MGKITDTSINLSTKHIKPMILRGQPIRDRDLNSCIYQTTAQLPIRPQHQRSKQLKMQIIPRNKQLTLLEAYLRLRSS